MNRYKKQFSLNCTAIKHKFLIGLGILALLSTISLNAFALDTSDESTIRALVMAFPEALNHKDMKAFADLFSKDADWINVVGMHWRGKAAVVKAHQVFLKTVFRNGGMSFTNLIVRAVTADVAIAVVTELDAGGGITPSGKTLPPGSGRLSFVLGPVNTRAC